MKNLLRLLLLAALLAGCVSCASSKRMTRISPFGEMPAKAELDRDRINAWPLAYHQEGSTSILWPIVDVDERGFAVRPLLNKEDHDWSLLFPLSSYNTSRKVGWLLSAYRYEDYAGVFPLFHRGEDLTAIGPFWKAGEDAFGLFPVAGRFDKLWHFGPLWWEHGDQGVDRGGLFPILYAGPDLERFWLWPLYAHDLNERWRRRSFLLSLASFRRDADGDHKHMLHPLCYDIKKGDQHTRALMPFYFGYQDQHRSLWLTPLYGQGVNTANGERYMTSLLGPLYVDLQDGNQRDLYLAAALAHWHRGPETAMWRLWPLASYASGTKDPDFLYHLTLAGYRKQGQRSEFNLTPLVHFEKGPRATSWGIEPLIGVRKAADYHRVSLLWSLLFKHALHTKDGEVTARNWHLNPLVSVRSSADYQQFSLLWSLLYKHRAWYKDNAHTRTRASGLLGMVRHDWNEEYARTSVLKYLYRRERRGEVIARDIFPFVSWDSAPDGGKVSLLWRLLSYEREGEQRGGHLLFIPWGTR